MSLGTVKLHEAAYGIMLFTGMCRCPGTERLVVARDWGGGGGGGELGIGRKRANTGAAELGKHRGS